jgi:hypothetical protein
MLNVVGDQRDVKITRQLHLDYPGPARLLLLLSPPNWYLKETRRKKKKMGNHRLKPFSSGYFHSFGRRSIKNLPHKTPYYRQPSVGLFSFCSFSSSSLQINYFVRGWKGETKKEAGGLLAAHRESSFISSSFLILHSSSGLSFIFYYFLFWNIINIPWSFNRYPLRFFLNIFYCFFYILEKDFVNYCFLPFENEAAVSRKKNK